MKKEISVVAVMVYIMLFVSLLFFSPVPAVAAEDPKADEFKVFERTWSGEIVNARSANGSGNSRSAVLAVTEVRGTQCKASLYLGTYSSRGARTSQEETALSREGTFTYKNDIPALIVPASKSGFDFVFLLQKGKVKLVEQITENVTRTTSRDSMTPMAMMSVIAFSSPLPTPWPKNTRPFDVIGRWGGEEFIGIIRNVNREQLEQLGTRLRVLVESSYLSMDNDTLHVSISVGATLMRRDDSMDTLLKRADTLLYESKRAGRNRLTIG